MKTLPNNLRKNGFTYTLDRREGNVAIYQQWYTKNVHYWEVFIVQVKPDTVIQGKLIPEHEKFPSDSDFGITAWSCRTLEDATVRFTRLVEKQRQEDLTND
jgi:hypothetical protein